MLPAKVKLPSSTLLSSPPRRDAVCQQCHLEGETTVRLAGETANDFKPGDVLTDYIAYFVHDRQATPNIRAVSQVEALSQSLCKRRSGDAMSCTSCHDPHRTISSEERANWYRAKCIVCHSGVKLTKEHHPQTPDCTACHMPQGDTTDIAHEQSTDHRILRQPNDAIDLDEPSSKLVAIIGSHAGAREYGLAYLNLAQRGDLFAKGEALRFLREASVALPQDAAVAFALGQLFASQGEQAKATQKFRAAFLFEPTYPGAAAAVGDADELQHDLSVWQQAYALDPSDVGLGLRLALAECRSGDLTFAERTLKMVTRFSPDFSAAKTVLTRLSTTGEKHCQSVPTVQ